MSTIRSITYRGAAPLALVGLALLALVAGCLPGAAWLPDSSGFVFVAAGEPADPQGLPTLFYYDVAKNERRVVAERLTGVTLWPAVSPDGKSFAVATIAAPGERMVPELEIVAYDLAGRESHRSPKFIWGEKPNDEKDHPCGLYWVATANRILVFDYQEEGQTGIYDPISKRLVLVEGIPVSIAGSPSPPDGSGFLVLRGDEHPQLYWVDWRGEAKPLRQEEGLFNSMDKVEAVRFSWLGVSRWDGPVGVIRYAAHRIRIDVEKQTASSETLPPEKALVDGKEVLWDYTFSAGGAKLRVRKHADAVDAAILHLELLRPGNTAWETLGEMKEGGYLLIPAPNEKWAAIRYGDDQQKMKQMIVISDAGVVRRVMGEK